MAPKKRAASDDYDSDDGFVEKKTKTKHSSSKSDVTGGGSRNEQGEEYWEISSTRRLVVSEFKGKRMISIREYYEKDGQTLPGKKGITLPLAQFSTLVTLLPAVEAVLQCKGESLPRPEYDWVPMPSTADEEDDVKPSVKKNKKQKHKNFEATSSEDDE